MIFPRYYKDVESFKEYCWWWIDIKLWVDKNMPTGWVFKEAYDIHQDAKSYLVVFESILRDGERTVKFSYQGGALEASADIQPRR